MGSTVSDKQRSVMEIADRVNLPEIFHTNSNLFQRYQEVNLYSIQDHISY